MRNKDYEEQLAQFRAEQGFSPFSSTTIETYIQTLNLPDLEGKSVYNDIDRRSTEIYREAIAELKNIDLPF